MTSDAETRQIVMVTWEDAHAETTSGWLSELDVSVEPYTVQSVGILLPVETKPGHVSICQSYAYGFVDTVLHVPCAMVTEVTTLEVISVSEDT